jgi:hypothetical protein
MIGGGEMGDRVRETDWSQTPLGDYDSWPVCLRTSLSLVLNAKGIAALYWGEQQWLLYNDAYGLALGDRHPRAFGQPMPEVLTDIAPVLSPQVAKVLETGEGFAIENLSNDVRLITTAALQAVDYLYRPGYRYSKAEVLLMDLRQPGEFTNDLFAELQPVATHTLMGVLDEINGRWGRGTLRTAAMPAHPDWAMRRELMSQSYTTRLDQLWTVKAN